MSPAGCAQGLYQQPLPPVPAGYSRSGLACARGPACAEDAADLGDAEAYLNHLEAYENAGQIQIDALAEGLANLYALPDLKADGTLQIMTLHKAKGLEFDPVILPGLGRSSRNETRKLFMWMENLRTSSSMDEMNRGDELLLAPIQETGGEPDRIYPWLEKLNSEKARFEDERLLYVAATRAKKRLHLLGSTSLVLNQDGRAELRVPPRKSLLEKIWPVVQPVYEEAAQSVSRRTRAGPEDSRDSPIDQSMRRLVQGWAFRRRLKQYGGSQIWLQVRSRLISSIRGPEKRLAMSEISSIAG